jgi:ElaB/YqjD/DUF883 family membrane-anchored ribosome-binding protein
MNIPNSNNTQEPVHAVDKALSATQQFANQKLDGLSEGTKDKLAPMINKLSSEAQNLVSRSIKTATESTKQLRDQAIRASEVVTTYIRQEPVKSVLIAGAAGAFLMLVASLLSRSRSTHN